MSHALRFSSVFHVEAKKKKKSRQVWEHRKCKGVAAGCVCAGQLKVQTPFFLFFFLLLSIFTSLSVFSCACYYYFYKLGPGHTNRVTKSLDFPSFFFFFLPSRGALFFFSYQEGKRRWDFFFFWVSLLVSISGLSHPPFFLYKNLCLRKTVTPKLSRYISPSTRVQMSRRPWWMKPRTVWSGWRTHSDSGMLVVPSVSTFVVVVWFLFPFLFFFFLLSLVCSHHK